MKKIAIGVALLVVLAAAAVFLFRSSDEEKIENLLKDCAQAAERGDPEGILRHVSRSCRIGEGDYAAVESRVRRELKEPGRLGQLSVGSTIHVIGDEADANVLVRSRILNRDLGEKPFKVKLKREEGDWKIVYVDEVK